MAKSPDKASPRKAKKSPLDEGRKDKPTSTRGEVGRFTVDDESDEESRHLETGDVQLESLVNHDRPPTATVLRGGISAQSKGFVPVSKNEKDDEEKDPEVPINSRRRRDAEDKKTSLLQKLVTLLLLLGFASLTVYVFMYTINGDLVKQDANGSSSQKDDPAKLRRCSYHALTVDAEYGDACGGSVSMLVVSSNESGSRTRWYHDAFGVDYFAPQWSVSLRGGNKSDDISSFLGRTIHSGDYLSTEKALELRSGDYISRVDIRIGGGHVVSAIGELCVGALTYPNSSHGLGNSTNGNGTTTPMDALVATPTAAPTTWLSSLFKTNERDSFGHSSFVIDSATVISCLWKTTNTSSVTTEPKNPLPSLLKQCWTSGPMLFGGGCPDILSVYPTLQGNRSSHGDSYDYHCSDLIFQFTKPNASRACGFNMHEDMLPLQNLNASTIPFAASLAQATPTANSTVSEAPTTAAAAATCPQGQPGCIVTAEGVFRVGCYDAAEPRYKTCDDLWKDLNSTSATLRR